MTVEFAKTDWAIILGGSSGFGLATARKLAAHGMSLAIAHRDRRGAMERIAAEFQQIRDGGARIVTVNADALDRAARGRFLAELAETMGTEGRVRVLLHSIAFGNLKLVAPERRSTPRELAALAAELAVEECRLSAGIERLFVEGHDRLQALAPAPEYPAGAFVDEEDLGLTIHSMGTSLLGWTQVGSSRVDLQACKLEYSIVSPK